MLASFGSGHGGRHNFIVASRQRGRSRGRRRGGPADCGTARHLALRLL